MAIIVKDNSGPAERVRCVRMPVTRPAWAWYEAVGVVVLVMLCMVFLGEIIALSGY